MSSYDILKKKVSTIQVQSSTGIAASERGVVGGGDPLPFSFEENIIREISFHSKVRSTK